MWHSDQANIIYSKIQRGDIPVYEKAYFIPYNKNGL